MDDASTSLPIYTGLWTNWSHGSTLGSTLTLTRADGNLLIAFVAFFVTVLGTHIWRIACFLLHWHYSRPTPQDAFHHQRQAVLRNTADASGGVWTLVQLGWAQRRAAVVPVVAAAVALTVLLAVASGFSSRVALGNEVLVAGTQCGIVTRELHPDVNDGERLYVPWQAKRIDTAAEYAQRCYGAGGRNSPLSSTAGCGTFVQRALPFAITRNASCPFDSSLCLRQDANLLLDTGLLDSHGDLGLNSASDKRFQYRTTLQCAPLVTEGYRTHVNTSVDRSYMLYNYGNLSDCNCTVRASMDLRLQGTEIYDPYVGYTLFTHGIYYKNGSLDTRRSTFDPIPAFVRPAADAETNLIFLFPNAIAFTDKSTDDWYRATTPQQGTASDGTNSLTSTYYTPDEPAWPLGCVRQDQYCNPTTQHCTPLSGLVDARPAAVSLFNTTPGLGLWINQLTLHFPTLQSTLETLGSRALASRYDLAGNMQNNLPARAWQRDVQGWFETGLAALQLGLLGSAVGPAVGDAELGVYVRRPNGSEEVRLCGAQKVLSAGHVSFSVFGLLFVFAVGVLLMVLSGTLEGCTGALQRRLGRDPYPRLEWRTNYTLQLQRLAYEGRGVGGDWQPGAWNVPVTEKGARLVPLDVSNPRHPRLGGEGPLSRRGTGETVGAGETSEDLVHGSVEESVVMGGKPAR